MEIGRITYRTQKCLQLMDARMLASNISCIASHCAHKRTKILMKGHAWKIVRANNELRGEAMSRHLKRSLLIAGDSHRLERNLRTFSGTAPAKDVYDEIFPETTPEESAQADLASAEASLNPGNLMERLKKPPVSTYEDLTSESASESTVPMYSSTVELSETTDSRESKLEVEPVMARAPELLSNVSDVELLEALLLVKMKRASASDHFETIGCTAQAAKRDRPKTIPQSAPKDFNEDVGEDSAPN